MVTVNMREMLEAGVHFGHQVRKWNPKMKPYIYGEKNGIYIINLQTSIEMFKTALNFISETVSSGKEALIVGTKKQAQSIITDIAEECGMHYVNKRWLGGLLTNFSVVKKSIEKLMDLDEMKRDGRWEVKSKKEQSKLEKIYKKLHKNLWGMRNIKELPGVVIVIDSNFEDIAVYEARKLEIPIVAVVDTNSNPEEITFPVPGNDDAIRSIKLFSSKFGEAVKIGLERRLTESISEAEAAESEEPEEKEIKVKEGIVEKAVVVKEEGIEVKQEEKVEVKKEEKKVEEVEKAEVKKEEKEVKQEEKAEVKKEKKKVEEVEKAEVKKEEKEVKQEEKAEDKKEEKKVEEVEKAEVKKEEKEVKKEEKAEVKKEEKKVEEVEKAEAKKEKKEAKKEEKVELKKEEKAEKKPNKETKKIEVKKSEEKEN